MQTVGISGNAMIDLPVQSLILQIRKLLWALGIEIVGFLCKFTGVLGNAILISGTVSLRLLAISGT